MARIIQVEPKARPRSCTHSPSGKTPPRQSPPPDTPQGKGGAVTSLRAQWENNVLISNSIFNGLDASNVDAFNRDLSIYQALGADRQQILLMAIRNAVPQFPESFDVFTLIYTPLISHFSRKADQKTPDQIKKFRKKIHDLAEEARSLGLYPTATALEGVGADLFTQATTDPWTMSVDGTLKHRNLDRDRLFRTITANVLSLGWSETETFRRVSSLLEAVGYVTDEPSLNIKPDALEKVFKKEPTDRPAVMADIMGKN